MIETATIRENYSGVVHLRLRVGEREFPLSKIGPDYVVFRDPVDLPPGNAEIVMTIDDREHRWPVSLVEGASPTMEIVAVLSIDTEIEGLPATEGDHPSPILHSQDKRPGQRGASP